MILRLPQSSEQSVDQTNASTQEINLFPPAQEGLKPIIMNPPQVLVRTCLTTHIYTQEKATFLSGEAEGISLFLPLHTWHCGFRTIHHPQNHFRNIQQQCRVFEREHLYLLPFLQKSRLATFAAIAGRRTDPPAHYSFEKFSCFCFLPKLQQTKKNSKQKKTSGIIPLLACTHLSRLPSKISFLLHVAFSG